MTGHIGTKSKVARTIARCARRVHAKPPIRAPRPPILAMHHVRLIDNPPVQRLLALWPFSM